MQIDWTNDILLSISQLIGRQFALKVGFAKWYDRPETFCRKLTDNKNLYSNPRRGNGFGPAALQHLQNKLEFTKFQCLDNGNANNRESCAWLTQFENNLRGRDYFC